MQLIFALLSIMILELTGYLLAALIGISLGLIGGGGSILTVPLLVYIMGVNPLLATSYSLFIVGATSLVGAVNNYHKGFVNIKTALLFGISSISAVFLTRKFLLPSIPQVFFPNKIYHFSHESATMVFFAILMLLAAIAMIRKSKDPNQSTLVVLQDTIPILKLFSYGALIGLVTGLLGAGGGFLLIPFLVLVIKIPMKQAVGTSLLIIALNSLIGFTGDLGHFIINWTFLLSITAVAITGIFIGGLLSKKIKGEKLKIAFGWFVLVMGIYIIVKELFFTA
ncbi:MAG: sulfite exporter TauE/SafE family protein [Ferruginibacter sp.]